MNDFRTNVRVERSELDIDLKTQVLTVGSCFADAIGNRMLGSKFRALVNPFGTIFNPISINDILNHALKNELPGPGSFVESQGLHANYLVHSRFSNPSRERLQSDLQKAISDTHQFLQQTRVIIVTYGTAFVHERMDTGSVVANCHKLPANQFRKRLLGVDEIVDAFQKLHQAIAAVAPGIKYILTVSPVRHTKETLPLNAVSKSALRLACHQLSEQFADVEYFPAYEILMDDLRDYRFYKADMIHPTELAEDYIFEKFCECYMDESTRRFVSEWKKIMSAIAHRPFLPSSRAHQQFIRDTLVKLERFTDVDTSAEREELERQLVG